MSIFNESLLKINNLKIKANNVRPKKILWNLNGTALINEVKPLQTVLLNGNCSKKAIEAQKIYIPNRKLNRTFQKLNDELIIEDRRHRVNDWKIKTSSKLYFNNNKKDLSNRVNDSELNQKIPYNIYSHMKILNHTKEELINSSQYEINKDNIKKRDKRESQPILQLDKEKSNKNVTLKTNQNKKVKGRKPTVIKFVNNGEIYALKVKEYVASNSTICHVYEVVNDFTCGSPEANLLTIMTNRQKRYNHENVIKSKLVSTTKNKNKKSKKTLFRKRNTSSYHVSRENLWPSIEELY